MVWTSELKGRHKLGLIPEYIGEISFPINSDDIYSILRSMLNLSTFYTVVAIKSIIMMTA